MPKDKTASASLREQRAALIDAEEELRHATERMDVDGVVQAQNRVSVLRAFITRLEADAVSDAEREGQDKARAWLKQHVVVMATASKQVAEAQDAARVAVAKAVAAIEAEAAARKAVEDASVAAEVLAHRFQLPVPDRRTSLPPVEDWAASVSRATDGLRPSRTARRGLVIVRPASASSDQLRQAALRAVGEFMDRSSATLPADAREILEGAPVPADVAKRPRERTAEAERLFQPLADAAAQARQMLSGIPGDMPVGSL